MTFFALTLQDSMRENLLIVVQCIFITFVLFSFIFVAGYFTRQLRLGTLVNGSQAPSPVPMPALASWFFIASVVGMILLQSPLYAILVMVGIWGALMENRRSAQQQFGLNRLRPMRVITWSLLGFGAVMLVETPLTQFSVETFRQFNMLSTIVWFMFQAVFLFPVIEELFFRGFLMTFLKTYTSTWMAIVLSAGIFGFAHLNLGAVLPLWFLGIVLGIAYEHTGSLALPMGIHACFNLATALRLLMDRGNS
jgi:membrane protease YdiL (CAAX protease family)